MNNTDTDTFEIIKPKEKLFGEKALRVTTSQMNIVFQEIKNLFHGDNHFTKYALSKPLPSKVDHGDIDIVIQSNKSFDLKKHTLKICDQFHQIIEYVENGPILHCLFSSHYIQQQVHVDFIFANENEYDSTLMYLSYNDFSGILGVIARKLKFNYGNKGFYKIYIDKKNQYHYILLTRNLKDGLKILGYDDIISSYEDIQSIDDIVTFLSFSDLFDSSYLTGTDLNRGDRKRMRAGRPTARELKEKLIALNKNRKQVDDDFYLKQLFPEIHQKYLDECKRIEEFVPIKTKYNGHWIMLNFPDIKPGPVIKKIQLHWTELYGEKLDSVDEQQLIQETSNFLKN